MVTAVSASVLGDDQRDLSDLEDGALIMRSLADEKAAFGVLVRRYQQAVFNVCYRVLHNRQDAEDMAQESFVRGFRKLATFDASRPFGPWIKRVAVNVCINYKKRQPETPFTIDEERDHPDVDDEEHPVRAAERRESAETLRRAIASLPAHYAAVLELRHFQELSYDEIAAALDVPVNTAKSHLFRARKMLAERVKRDA